MFPLRTHRGRDLLGPTSLLLVAARTVHGLFRTLRVTTSNSVVPGAPNFVCRSEELDVYDESSRGLSTGLRLVPIVRRE